MMRRRCMVAVVLLAGLLAVSQSSATQIDHRGSYQITYQVWKLDLTIAPQGQDSFSVRFPYPNYTWVGRWDSYATKDITVDLTCEAGPLLYEFHHYNQGYSNQGVWIKVIHPPSDITLKYRIRQSAKLSLPGHDYALLHFTNNGWMTGSYIVDVNAWIVQQSLASAQQLPGIWNLRGYWKEPEQVVNWMHEYISWLESTSYTLRQASQVISDADGDCKDWAHAACAMLLRAGIPAKTVLVGALDGSNGTRYQFPHALMHVSLAYWDGFGWILIDPYMASGFTFGSRVILGADRDVSTVRIVTDPEYLLYSAPATASCENGNKSGCLTIEGYRCSSYPWDILEHYELPDPENLQGTEPMNNIIPNLPTSVDVPPLAGSQFIVNYPNPFNPSTTFGFRLERPGHVRIDIFSVDGALVANVIDAAMTAGEKRVEWRTGDLASGVYLVRYEAPGIAGARKIIVLK